MGTYQQGEGEGIGNCQQLHWEASEGYEKQLLALFQEKLFALFRLSDDLVLHKNRTNVGHHQRKS